MCMGPDLSFYRVLKHFRLLNSINPNPLEFLDENGYSLEIKYERLCWDSYTSVRIYSADKKVYLTFNTKYLELLAPLTMTQLACLYVFDNINHSWKPTIPLEYKVDKIKLLRKINRKIIKNSMLKYEINLYRTYGCKNYIKSLL